MVLDISPSCARGAEVHRGQKVDVEKLCVFFSVPQPRRAARLDAGG